MSESHYEDDPSLVEEEKRGFRRIMQDQGSRRLLTIVGVIFAVLVVFAFIFSGGGGEAPSSSVPKAPDDGSAVQGANAVSPQYAAELQADDSRRADAAEKAGTSSTPTIVATNAPAELKLDTEPQTTVPEEVVETPAAELDLSGMTGSQASSSPKPQAQRPVIYNDNRVGNMMAAFENIAKADVADPSTNVVYDAPEKSSTNSAQTGTSDTGLSLETAPEASGAEPVLASIPLPGTVIYGQMVSEANSDAPGPVIADILQGPLAGSRLIGSFDKGNDKLVVRFSTLTVKTLRDGTKVDKSYPIDAVAVDTKYIGTGMATDVNHHYLEKIGVAFGTSFLSGLGTAIASSGSTTVSGVGATGSAIISQQNPSLNTGEKVLVATGEAAKAVGSILQDQLGNRPTTVKVEAGTPIGVLFLDSQ